jgi:2-O-(6-phospho-alpha-D-mannosyl)-D-glycerate hydrolase
MLDIHIVSHTHWDREWYLTHEQFRFRLVALIDRLLDLLDANPEYKHFHLDGQTIVLEDYLEIRPDQEERLRRFIRDGRILVGPWYVMPDEFLVSGEAIVRNLARGHAISRQFGTPMPVGYLPDLFGHVAQMPQIWRQLGLDNTILWRGFGGRRAEYWWQAPDGSRVLMMHLPPEGYCNATRLVLDPDAMTSRAEKAIDFERDRTAVGQVLLMNGVDHVEPQARIPDLVATLSTNPALRVRHSTLPAYVAAVRSAVAATNTALDTVCGELRGGEDYANLLPGVLSARVYLKQHNARVQTLLESYAEPLAVFASILGARYPDGQLRHAWKTLLQNHPHDSICGCSIDAVHEENVTRFARAGQVAEAVITSALETIADSVAPGDAGSLRVVVVNVDRSSRSQVVDAFVDLPYETAEPWRHVDPQALDRPLTFFPRTARVDRVTDSDGNDVPFQLVSEEDCIVHEMSRFETPWALRARRLHLLWWGPSLPPCGYATFDLRLAPEDDGQTRTSARGMRPAPVVSSDRSAENDLIQLKVNDDATFDVVDKTTGTAYRGVGLIVDTGDVGDEYNYCPPVSDESITSRDARTIGAMRTSNGPLRATLRVDMELELPARATPDRSRRDANTATVPIHIDASVDAGSPRATFAIAVNNSARDHRLRILFPTATAGVETARADTAFDVVSRPARRAVPDPIVNEAPVSSAPLISVVDAGDERVGATVIAKGLAEYEILPSGVGEQDAIALTLIRAVGDLSRNDLATRPSGHAGPPVATPGAQCLGSHRFEIAFEPRGVPPPAGRLLASARAFAISPKVVAARNPNGTASRSRSFLNVMCSSGGVVLSALKKADDRDAVIVRLVNPGDVDADVRVVPGFPVHDAWSVNLLEERDARLSLEQGGVRTHLTPHGIQTIELVRNR